MPALAVLLDRLEARIARELLAAFHAMAEGTDLRALERRIGAGELQQAVAELHWELLQNALAEAQRDLVDVRERGWEEATKTLPPGLTKTFTVKLSFGADAQANPIALERLVRQDLTRIQNITKESQEAIREAVERGLRQGLNPREVALEIQKLIGVNRPQGAALARLRDRLTKEAHEAVEAAVQQGRGRVSARREMARHVTRINRILQKRQREMIVTRAETIARTEVMTALNAGKQAQWARLARDGVINPAEWEQEWVIADDERTCPICRRFDGQRAPIGGLFISTQFETSTGPPKHPRCRCTIRLVLAGFRVGKSTPAQRRRAPTPELPLPAVDVQATTATGARETWVEESPEQLTQRLAYEERTQGAKIEYGMSRLVNGEVRFYKGTRDRINFGARQVAEMMQAPLAMHNHPNATPFSPQDLRFAEAVRVKVMRVIGRGPDGPVSYEVDVGRAGHARGAAEAGEVLYAQLLPRYHAIFRQRMASGMSADDAERVTLTEHLHEVWTRIAQQFGFRYLRRQG